MKAGTIIATGLCATAVVGVFSWLFGHEPVGLNAPQVANTSQNRGVTPTVPVQRQFNPNRATAEPGNNEPVQIVIDSGTRLNAGNLDNGKPKLVVKVSGLNMRAGPSSRSETLGHYPRGAKFLHLRDENGWAHVQSLDDGQKGWMFKKYLVTEGG